MSSLRPGDQHLHHCDGSHRWSGGPADPRANEAYLAALRDHIDQHRAVFTSQPVPQQPTPARRRR